MVVSLVLLGPEALGGSPVGCTSSEPGTLAQPSTLREGVEAYRGGPPAALAHLRAIPALGGVAVEVPEATRLRSNAGPGEGLAGELRDAVRTSANTPVMAFRAVGITPLRRAARGV